MHRTLGLTVLLIALLCSSWADVAAASEECPDIDAWPPFTEVAPRAHRVVIGTVSEAESGVATRIAVEEILRGNSSRYLDMGLLRARFGPIPAECTFDGTVQAEVGDRLALAMRARLPGIPGRRDSAALLDADLDHDNGSELDRLTTPQVRMLLAHEPDGSTVDAPRGRGPSPDLLDRLLRALPGSFLDIVELLADEE